MASTFEAVAGALFLDLGFEPVRDFVVALADPELVAEAPIGMLKSPKSRLQEYTQRHAGDRPTYRLVNASGPDHERSFRIEVLVGGELLGVGEGPSRRSAETAAAAQAMERLRAVGAGPDA
jgi:ribonuclease-3